MEDVMTAPRQKNPREGDASWEQEKDRTTNPNRRQEEDEMNEESQRGGQRTRDRDYGSTEPRPGDRRDEGGRKPNDPARKHPDRTE
jgi:hypothetical protein